MLHYTLPGLDIATDTVANATNIFSWATKNSGLVATLLTRKQTVHLILLCFRHKKCAKSHKQSQFTSKFIPTSVHDIFKQSNLIGLGIQVRGIFRDRFAEIFGANLAEKQSEKNGRFRGNFLGKFRYKSIDFVMIWRECLNFLTEIIICYYNNKALEKWAYGKAFNIMTSVQVFAT